jgi:hypothetical protein
MGDTPRIRLPRAGERFVRVILKYLAPRLRDPARLSNFMQSLRCRYGRVRQMCQHRAGGNSPLRRERLL